MEDSPVPKGYIRGTMLKDEGKLHTNKLLIQLKRRIQEDKAGISVSDESFHYYHSTITALSKEVYHDPSILDRYAISLDLEIRSISDLGFKRELNLRERLLFYWANPWLFVYDIITVEVINKTTPANVSFKGFIAEQKQYLRDFCDPRVHGMIMSCCRGGSKTWLNAIGIVVMEYLVPKMRITINSGSKEQSQYLYQYYRKFISGTVMCNLIEGDSLQSHTNYKHGGWVKALTASEKSMRGPRPDLLVFDETCQAEDHIIKSALGGTFTSANLKIIFSSTPNKMNHVFYEVWSRVKEYGFKKYHWDCYDVPWISDDNIQMAKDIYDKNTFRIEMLGLFGSTTGMVFDRDEILASKVSNYDKRDGSKPELVATSIGIDWGFSHLTVVTTVGLDESGLCYVLDCHGRAGVKEDAWVHDIVPSKVRKFQPASIQVDSAAAFQNKALNDALPSDLSAKRIAFSKYKDRMIGELRRRFEQGIIRIKEGGENDKLIEQLLAYEYAKDISGAASNKPAKGNDDYIDSLLLAVWGLRPDFYSGIGTPSDIPSAGDLFADDSDFDYFDMPSISGEAKAQYFEVEKDGKKVLKRAEDLTEEDWEELMDYIGY